MERERVGLLLRVACGLPTMEVGDVGDVCVYASVRVALLWRAERFGVKRGEKHGMEMWYGLVFWKLCHGTVLGGKWR